MPDKEESSRREAICPGKLDKAELLAAREKLAATEGPEYWRSLEELAGSPEFRERLHREFPKGVSEWLDPISRRGFLKLMGASLALAGMTGCVKQPLETIVPYVRQPEQLVPGRPLFYASSMTLRGYAFPVLVESNMGRPTKIEGNPEHPASLGGSDLYSQASILGMYDPDRSETILFNGEIRPWLSFVGAVRSVLAAGTVRPSGLRFLTRTVSSPTFAAQLQDLLKQYPGSRWHQWEPWNRDRVRAGAQLAFGRDVETQYRVGEADIILSLDADFLYPTFPGFHRYTREWASRRRPDSELRPFADGTGTLFPGRPMNRIYALESTPAVTGAKADHRLMLSPSEIERYARIIASRLGISAGGGSPRNDSDEKWINALVKDLRAHRGAGMVIVGDQMPPVVHALAHAMNESLGNTGKTVVYTDPVVAAPTDQLTSVRELVSDMNAGRVDMLVIMGGNPVYDAPADLDFRTVLEKVPTSVYHGLYLNETGAVCKWHINATHYLEAWSDARAYNGVYSIVQPLIAPLYGGRSEHELLAVLGRNPERSGYDIVRSYWQAQWSGDARLRAAQPVPGDFEHFWRQSVHDGYVRGTELPPLPVRVKTTGFESAEKVAAPAQGGEMELIIRPDPSTYDGCFSNNAWLQEVPKPLTQLTWDNPVMFSVKTAQRLGLENGSVIELEFQGRKLLGAVWMQPGHPDDALTIFLGYGRERAGRAGTGMGYNAYKVRVSNALYGGMGAKVRDTGDKYKLITGQGLQDMEGRPIIVEGTLDEYRKDALFAHRELEEPPNQDTLYPNYHYTGYAWGMLIDQNACVGCNACIIACQSENNIPVVGKLQVAIGRRMHWLRVDTYYKGDASNPRAFFQPVPCMHCENAPCELVCPVEATVHSTEGLNEQIYNRCVGTRYCSNNCPYKVRRFNFLLFQDWVQPQYKMMRNPEVSVRSRGVMEKCTYCVQRITAARIQAEEENRLIRDHELQTACQQACPADAIVFGDINQKAHRVAELKANPRNYGLLADMNTRPRTTYLAMVFNPNPEIAVSGEHHKE
ncbi:MAG: TAT-variant-translocated molybdopterin oxidoreductase [Terriglobales bacterium]